MRRVFMLAALALFSGCLCCGGDLPDLGGLGGSTEPGEDYCTPPYIQLGAGCCLDENANDICDSDESSGITLPTASTQPRQTTTTTQPSIPQATVTTTTAVPTTIPTPTTTQATGSCADGVRNNGEEYIDCGGPCTECLTFTLKSTWTEFKNTGYKFRFDEKEGVEGSTKYWIEIETPDGIKDRRYLSTGESFVDYLRFKVINYGEDTPKVYMRVNTEDLSSIPQDATLLTIGGRGCATLGSEMCERDYAGYKIRMKFREDNGAKIQIWAPGDEVPYEVTLTGTGKVFYPGSTLQVGGFFDRGHFITGGYVLFYVKM
jgi:hypothetical protein